MPAYCAVVNCSDKYVHAGSISFHRFPFKRKDLLQKWRDFTQRNGQWMPSKWSAVCSRHFVDADFNCSNNRKTLKKNAVPTVRVPEETLNVIVEQVTLPATDAVPASSCSGTKSTCRFCGIAALNCVSFEKSFELFAMIQKCFPTLQILQDDTLPLPKEICGDCCRQLERFSKFCDVVIVAQGELQRKYRRQLKIKQEPVVRVKQEACESLDNLFPDELDMGLDEGCCDHEPEANDETEQKFQFCNFPMLNAQDIINNCDIMEIINLDDPFINITDDADVAQAQPVSVPAVLPTPHELLQSELLTEEHNYAKEDWQLPPLQQYKTEKVEGAELQESGPTEPRSSKPIVTNVSQIPNPMICELMPAPAPAPAPASTKPNIVVLNDSVVQSSAFRLHNCSLCTTKFFTAESLQQHYAHAHATPTPTAAPAPMVSVPPPNLSQPTTNNTLKLESSTLPPLPAAVDYWQADWLPAQMPAKKKIDILDMQRSFLHYNDLIAQPAISEPQSPNYAYAKLAARYRRLQHKCRRLRTNLKPTATSRANPRLRCGRCSRGFASVQQLLGHRRRRRHFVVPPPRTFAVKCFGCLRLFCTRLGLRQHMRYICQSLPLRNARLQSYKCRHCQSISFTHWRIYRRHELKCRLRPPARTRPVKRRRTPNAGQAQAAKRAAHGCSVCQKTFSSLTGLKQHRITHSSERRYKCSICERVFKRRNGLSQHIKGYHLQLKPHQCPVCQHRYALKCDMLRCRHSQRRGAKSAETEPTKA
ncbi:zinc finger and SCAN domain-containing protein 10 [Drosophila novamexicana]|uniref:zinc finger and SCAN domain-containing protein 10 n=1 Tax=Drosophila novamexicana TaxID=47314 RepID=UPI0011E5C4B2|nr:zinc finger and SCAN domain-containing protein 10 [Drosophila novamexicana]